MGKSGDVPKLEIAVQYKIATDCCETRERNTIHFWERRDIEVTPMFVASGKEMLASWEHFDMLRWPRILVRLG